MTKLINVHCHLLNYQFISPSCFKSRGSALEWMIRHGSIRPLFRLVSAAMPRKKLHRLHEAYDLLKMDIRKVAARLRQEMIAADIQLAVPLVMDMGRAAFSENPQIPFNFQVKMISEISLEHLGVITPFIMVDPRRTRAADLLIRCLEDLGFYGAKLYPSLGYHPDPDSIYNDPQTNDELRKIYTYCESHMVPITAHCAIGGAYSNDILRLPSVRAEVSQPQNWIKVLKEFPGLHLNLAHFGQDLNNIKSQDSWAAQIRELIRSYPGVYTDLAYNTKALGHNTSRKYFEALTDILDNDRVLKERVLFGSDWSMTSHSWREVDYAGAFRKHLSDDKMRQIGVENSLDFLFPQRKYPDRVARFLRANGKSISDLPKWLLANVAFASARA